MTAVRSFFKRLWCVLAHRSFWEINDWNTGRCRKCQEIHNED